MNKVTETKKTEIINCNGAIRYNMIEIAVKATVVETFGGNSTNSYNQGWTPRPAGNPPRREGGFPAPPRTVGRGVPCCSI